MCEPDKHAIMSELKNEPHVGMKTPWGKADSVRPIADGIWFVGTPGHGGLKLIASLNAKMPKIIRSPGGWYEEDLAYNWVIVAFPELVERGLLNGTLENAHQTLRDWFPTEYEKVFGVKLTSSQSRELRKNLFKAEHANDWVAVSAETKSSWNPQIPDQVVLVTCQPAGIAHHRDAPTRRFLVPRGDYNNPSLRTPIGFICDPSPRHYEEIE